MLKKFIVSTYVRNDGLEGELGAETERVDRECEDLSNAGEGGELSTWLLAQKTNMLKIYIMYLIKKRQL